MVGFWGCCHIRISSRVRVGAARRTSASTREAGNGAGTAVLVKRDLGDGLLEMERFRMDLGAGSSGAKAIDRSGAMRLSSSAI